MITKMADKSANLMMDIAAKKTFAPELARLVRQPGQAKEGVSMIMNRRDDAAQTAQSKNWIKAARVNRKSRGLVKITHV
jgi:hypothetical protein